MNKAISIISSSINAMGIAVGTNIMLEDINNLLGIIVLGLNLLMIIITGLYNIIQKVKQKAYDEALKEAQKMTNDVTTLVNNATSSNTSSTTATITTDANDTTVASRKDRYNGSLQ